MKIHKKYLEIILLCLVDTKLPLPEARIRDGMAEELEKHLNTAVKDREKIYIKLCKKDNEGNPLLKNGNQYQFDASVEKELKKELDTLNSEKVNVGGDAAKMAQFISSTSYLPKYGEAKMIDEAISLI